MVLFAVGEDIVGTAAPWVAGTINLGFVGWLAWFLITKSIPTIVADNRKDLNEMMMANRADLRAERDSNVVIVTHLTETFNKEQEAARQHCIQEIHDTNQRWREIWMTGFREGEKTGVAAAVAKSDQSGIHS